MQFVKNNLNFKSNSSRTIFAILLCAFLVNLGAFMVIPFYTIYFHKVLNISLTFIGIAFSTELVAVRGMSLFGGILTDRFRSKTIMSIGLLLCAVSYSGLAITRTPVELILFSFLLGLGNSLAIPASKVILLQAVADNHIGRSTVLSLRNTAINLGIILGPLFGKVLITNSPAILFLSTSSIYLLSIIFLFFNVKYKNNNIPFKRLNFKEVTQVITKKEILPIFFLALFFMLGYVQIQLTIPLLANNISAQWGVLSVYITNALIVVTCSIPIAHYFISNEKALNRCLLGLLLIAIAFFILFITHVLSLLILAIIMLSVAEVIFFPTADLAITALLPEYFAGSAIGVVQLAYAIGGVIGNLIGGYLYQKLVFHNDGHYYWLILGILFIFISSIFRLSRLNIANQSAFDKIIPQ